MIRHPTEGGNGGTNHTEQFVIKFDNDYPAPVHDVNRDEIGGLDEIIDQLETFKRAVEFPKLYEFYGVNPPKGFILSGPPGYGKTYIAKHMSKALGARFMDVPLSKFESKWVGEAESKLTEIINDGRTYKNVTEQSVLIFFDEAEEAFKDRVLLGWHAPRVNVLLREMDGLSVDNTGIFFGAATNHLARVDPALMRPGRLDYHIEIPEYSSAGLADVVRAVAVRLNRRSQHIDPYVLTEQDHRILGLYANQSKLSPAHINEVFKRAADSKIKELSNGTLQANDAENFYIGRAELMVHLEKMSPHKNRKNPIGYRV